MSGPLFQHDCDNCVYLGRYSDANIPQGDLYLCPSTSSLGATVLCRASDDGPRYWSMLERYVVDETAKNLPMLAAAKELAKAKQLI